MAKDEKYNDFVARVKGCTECDLCELNEGRDPHVVGQGSLNAKLMFVAEAPGANEVLAQQPLTTAGKSGAVYERVLKYLGLTREQVYTTNTILCRPPNNRDPEPFELAACQPYLEQQLKLVQPQLVVTFGRFAASYFLGPFKMTKEHGKLRNSNKFNVQVFPLYHCAYIGCYASHQQREEFKRDLYTLSKVIGGFNGAVSTINELGTNVCSSPNQSPN
jgi:uracil-DNA glycosylase family 4